MDPPDADDSSKVRRKRDGRSKPRPGVEQQRRHILSSAATLFAERGSASVSVAELCRAADVSKPTFYRCFADKDALLEQLYQLAVHTPVQQGWRRDGDAPAGAFWTRERHDAVVDEIFEHGPLAALLYVESSVPGSKAAAIVERAFDESAETMAAWVRAQGGADPSRVILKGMLHASQWIVHDAIKRGATEAARSEAKEALWRMTSAQLGALLSRRA